MNDGQDDFIPYWLQTGSSWLNTAAPLGADLKQPAWSDPAAPPGPLMHPWEYPWPHISPMESRLQSPLDMWAQATQPNPSAALPPGVPADAAAGASRLRQVLAGCAVGRERPAANARILSLAGAANAELGPGSGPSADVSGR